MKIVLSYTFLHKIKQSHGVIHLYNGTGTFVILIVDLRLLTLFHIKKPDVNLQNLSLCYSGNKTKLTNDTHDSDPRTITHDKRTIAHDTHLDMMHERLLT